MGSVFILAAMWSVVLDSFVVTSVTANLGTLPMLSQQVGTGARENEGEVVSPDPMMTPMFDLEEEELWSHLRELGGHAHRLDSPSSEFMIKIFKDLLHGQRLTEAVGHTDGRTQPEVTSSDTIRGFSPYETRHNSRFRFNVPPVPHQEHLRMAEVRFRNSGYSDTNYTEDFTIKVRKDGKLIEKIRITTSLQRTGNESVFDLTSALSTVMNAHHGNVTVELRLKNKKNKQHLSKDLQIFSPKPILVFYSQDKAFMTTIMSKLTYKNHEQGDMKASRSKRAATKKRRKRKKDTWRSNATDKSDNLCKMYDFRVNFDLIGWGPWIIHPKAFNARVCYGECPEPIGHEYSPTNHAMLQTLMRMKRPLSAPQTCCVPTKLRPLSMLYIEFDDIVVRHHQDMVVGECGCR